MRWHQRALSGVLAAAIGMGLLGGIPQAVATDYTSVELVSTRTTKATGDIQAMIRMDYPISIDKLKDSDIAVDLYRGNQKIASGSLQEGTLTFTDGSAATGTVTWKTNETMVTSVDVQFTGLSAEANENQYYLELTGAGFQSYRSEILTLSNYSQGMILGTGDGTFTQGDLNGDDRVNEADIEVLKQYLDTENSLADLNGDGAVDITDLAMITMASGATGEAQVYQTSAILSKVVDIASAEQELEGTIKSGNIASLFTDNSETVRLAAKENESQIALPIPLTANEGVELEQVEIVSSTAAPLEKGVVEVTTVDGNTFEVLFDESTPDGVYAIQTRDDGRKVVTISLGARVPVKKITIRVEVVDNQEIVVEQIKFHKDILPENPVKENTKVQNVKAQAGAEQVALSWDTFPNITGYKVYYGTSQNQMTHTLETDRTSCTITNLENLKTYYFAVAPISTAGDQKWEGGKSDVVTATPQPASVPDKPDNVTVTPKDTMLQVTWKPGKDTQYSKVQYRVKGQSEFVVLDGEFQNSTYISGLENGVTYEVQVFGVNIRGNGPVSLTAEGTPEREDIEAPDLPTVNRLDNSVIVSATYPTNNTDTKVSQGQLPGAVYDGDYHTGWVATTWWLDKKFTFQFDQPYEMNYFIYVPNLGLDTQNNSGNRYRDYFTAFELWLNGEKVDESKVSFEKVDDNSYFIVKFPRTTVTSLTVQPKQWDGAGNMSLVEVAFYQYDGLADSIDAMFANGSHTALAAGVDQATIDALYEKASDVDAYYVDRAVLLDELDNAQQLLNGEELMVRAGFASRSGAADQKYGQTASALQPLGISALSNQAISIYVEGLGDGETATLVQWQQYSETGNTRQSYTLHNGRNRIYLTEIGNSGSGERGGSLYIEYSGSNANALKLQIRDTSEQKTVVTEIPMLNIDPTQWYGKSEDERKTLIRDYVQELQTYVAGLSFPNDSSRKTNIRNVTEIATPSVLLSLPADQVLSGLGGTTVSVEDATSKLYNAICAWEQLLFLVNKTQGIIQADADFASYQYPMQTRQNIRFSRMFSGAFMFAAGSYIGIDYNETRAMVTGYPVEMTGSGSGIDGDDLNGLYGWGIAHEIGHNMDKIGYAEITNNIYSLVAQTADTGDMVGQSRLEGMYQAIFDKVALRKPGQAGDVFTQLGMYWQLHLAYDEAGSPFDGSGALDFYNAFFSKWKAGVHSDAPSKDDQIALIAAEVTGKNLTEFFTRWGMELSVKTKETLAEYENEPRNIWYLNDQSRRDRLNGENKAELTANLTAVVENEKQVKLTVTVSGDASRVQGYEILRNGTPVGFLMGNGENTQTYVDTVGAANHMSFTYSVRVIDKLGYEVATAQAEQVRISYDVTLDATLYDISEYGLNQDTNTKNIQITAKDGGVLTTSGLKIVGDSIPTSGDYTVTITTADGRSVIAKSDRFSNSQSENSFLTYWNKPDTDATDTRIWMYDATSIVISGIPDDVSTSNIQLLSYPGDNIAFTEGASIGILGADYSYTVMDEEGKTTTETISAGTIIITGSYRGDPIYNSIRVKAKMQSMKPGSSEAPVVTEQTLSGETLLFAEIPKDGAVSTISDGFFVFIPENQESFKQVNEDHGENHAAGNLVMIALQAQMWRAVDSEGSNPRMTSDTLFISVPRYDSMPEIILKS